MKAYIDDGTYTKCCLRTVNNDDTIGPAVGWPGNVEFGHIALFKKKEHAEEFARGHGIRIIPKPEPKVTVGKISEALTGHFEHIAYKDHVRVYTDQGFIDVYPVKGGVIHTTFREDLGLGWLRVKWLLRSKGLDVK